MEAIKFIWEENDRFDTIREKAVELIGSKVINKENEKLPYTIAWHHNNIRLLYSPSRIF